MRVSNCIIPPSEGYPPESLLSFDVALWRAKFALSDALSRSESVRLTSRSKLLHARYGLVVFQHAFTLLVSDPMNTEEHVHELPAAEKINNHTNASQGRTRIRSSSGDTQHCIALKLSSTGRGL